MVKFGNVNDLLFFKKRTSYFPIYSAHALRDAVGLKKFFRLPCKVRRRKRRPDAQVARAGRTVHEREAETSGAGSTETRETQSQTRRQV